MTNNKCKAGAKPTSRKAMSIPASHPETPPLDYSDMYSAISALLEISSMKNSHWGMASSYLHSCDGVLTIYGRPHCTTCDKGFSSNSAWAKHMMSKTHILVEYGTTAKDVAIAEAWLNKNKNEDYGSLYMKRITVDQYLANYYPNEDEEAD